MALCVEKWLIKSLFTIPILIFGLLSPVTAYEAPIPEPLPEVEQTTVNYSCEYFRSELEKYDWDVDTVIKIMILESGCKPTNHNYNDTHKNYYTGEVICKGSYGLMQVGCIHYNGEDKDDWQKNIEIAYRVYKDAGGFTPWTTYAKIK